MQQEIVRYRVYRINGPKTSISHLKLSKAGGGKSHFTSYSWNNLLEEQLSYDPVCPTRRSVGKFVGRSEIISLKGWEVTLRSTY